MSKEMFKRACLISNERRIARYLMANAEGRLDGYEKAQKHMELCEFYVLAVLGVKKTGIGVCDHFDKLHRDTQEALTDRLDEVIGFPLKGRPDYSDLLPKFFEVWHETALKSLLTTKTA